MEKITKEMNIAEIIQNNPGATEVFINAGIHCIGCIAAQFETLEEGLKAHGSSDEDIEKFVEDLNKANEKK